MLYPINQRAHQFNSIQSVPVSFGLWDTALKFLSPGPRSDVTDHLENGKENYQMFVNKEDLDFNFHLPNFNLWFFQNQADKETES